MTYCVEGTLNDVHELFACWSGVIWDNSPVTHGCW